MEVEHRYEGPVDVTNNGSTNKIKAVTRKITGYIGRASVATKALVVAVSIIALPFILVLLMLALIVSMFAILAARPMLKRAARRRSPRRRLWPARG